MNMKQQKKMARKRNRFPAHILPILTEILVLFACVPLPSDKTNSIREKISINENWSFYKYPSAEESDDLIYDIRPEVQNFRDDRDADSRPTGGVEVEKAHGVLKPWILPSANPFIKDPEKWHLRPEGNPGSDFPFVQHDFDDSTWEKVELPHDWAIKGPFFEGNNPEVGGSMGRLPVNGVAWYRRKLDIPKTDSGRSIFLHVDGAMSYAMVWLNKTLVGGWPYGYNSWRLDLTPYMEPGGDNQLAIRIDNPNHSSRWYPGAGIYRNVWLIKTHPVHVAQWGTFITTRDVSTASAKIDVEVAVANDAETESSVEIKTQFFTLNEKGKISGKAVAELPAKKVAMAPGQTIKTRGSVTIPHPRLWGPPPSQHPHLYLAVTKLTKEEEVLDVYKTTFGIRTIELDPDRGVVVNGEHIPIQGVNQHHDLGALGAAFNRRAAERQLEILRELGCNAIRMAHNPPDPELLNLTDKMGFLVIDEIFDVWERRKTPHDFHLVFPDWHEPDTRAFIRRDRNHPSIILWSYGNEVGEQYTAAEGAALGRKLVDIIKEEDPTRLTTASMNYAKPGMEFPEIMDVITLNYQGEGIRDAPAYSHLRGITTAPLYPSFHESYPDKVILSSESASTLSTRGTYIFPVFDGISAPISDETGGDSQNQYVSSYELYTANFGASPDKVFASQDRNPFVGGEFVWTGWDHLGEPTPYYSARSSYSGIIDLAGFRKDRFYLYQSRWRPDFPMAHILPHWNWPERMGEITPVHLITSGDEAELFLNGKSLGRKKKGQFEYRLRWDNVDYEPGELKAVAYKNGVKWAEDVVKTTEKPAFLQATTDRTTLVADGKDLSFITVQVKDKNGLPVPDAENTVLFDIKGPGEIVATDNGDPTNRVPFPAHERKAFNGLVLAIVQSKNGEKGEITVTATSPGLESTEIKIKTIH
jgi:beta-galactosidase